MITFLGKKFEDESSLGRAFSASAEKVEMLIRHSERRATDEEVARMFVAQFEQYLDDHGVRFTDEDPSW